MMTSDIFNTKPSTARSKQTRESLTFQHQDIFNQDKQDDQSNKYKPIILDEMSMKIALQDKHIDKNNPHHLQEYVVQQNDKESNLDNEDVSKNRKFKSWQSNIFHEPAKENFYQNIEQSQKGAQDKLEIGAYDINWWDTKNYNRTQNVNTISPAKVIEEHNFKLAQVLQSPLVQQYEQVRVNNKNFSDIFDSGLSRYYDVIKQKPSTLSHLEDKQPQESTQSVIQQNDKRKEVQNLNEELPSDFAKIQKLKGMSSIFDTHNYYNKLIQQNQNTEIKQVEIKQEPQSSQGQTLTVPNSTHKYVRIIVRGLNSKFDQNKFKQFSQDQNCYVTSITQGRDEQKRHTHSLIVKFPIISQKNLNNIEKYLISQSGCLVKREYIKEEDYIASLGPIIEIKPNLSLLIVKNSDKIIPQDNKKNRVQKRAMSAKQQQSKKKF